MTDNILENTRDRYLSKRRYGGNRGKVLNRDNYSCVVCGKETDMCVHHKDKNLKNNKVNNLVTLCRQCHINAHKSKTIDKRNFKIYDLRMKDGLTYRQIGIQYGISRQRVQQIVYKVDYLLKKRT